MESLDAAKFILAQNGLLDAPKFILGGGGSGRGRLAKVKISELQYCLSSQPCRMKLLLHHSVTQA